MTPISVLKLAPGNQTAERIFVSWVISEVENGMERKEEILSCIQQFEKSFELIKEGLK